MDESIFRRGVAEYEDDEPRGSSGRTASIETVAACLRGIPNPDPSDDTWDRWNTVGLALHAATGGSPDGLALFHEWSTRSPKYDPRETARRWAHYHNHPATRMNGAAKLRHLFKANQGGGDE